MASDCRRYRYLHDEGRFSGKISGTPPPPAVPSWAALPPWNWSVGEVVNINLRDYIADYGWPLTVLFTEVGSNLPTSVSVQGNGMLTGTVDAGQEGSYTPTFRVENTTGPAVPDAVGDVTVTSAAPAADGWATEANGRWKTEAGGSWLLE